MPKLVGQPQINLPFVDHVTFTSNSDQIIFNTKNAFQQVKFGLKLEVNAGSKTTTTTTTTLSTSCNF
jgi:hypothetical protein